MRTLLKEVPWHTNSETFRLYHLTDLHLGAKACDEALLKRDIAAIAADDHALWLGGDYIDGIVRRGDKRGDEHSLAPWCYGIDDVIGAQEDRVIDLLSPIASKCIGLIEGNHERSVRTHSNRNTYRYIVRGIANAAGVTEGELALGVNGFVVVRFVRQTPNSTGPRWPLVIYSHHGYGGGRLAGGHALTLHRIMDVNRADLVLLGHRHTQVTVTKTYQSPDARTGLAKQHIAIGQFTASYLRAYVTPSTNDTGTDTYSERAGYFPQHIGATPITIRPAHLHVSVTTANTAGVEYFMDEYSA